MAIQVSATVAARAAVGARAAAARCVRQQAAAKVDLRAAAILSRVDTVAAETARLNQELHHIARGD